MPIGGYLQLAANGFDQLTRNKQNLPRTGAGKIMRGELHAPDS
ncbi:MAG: hypothetical protein O7I42_20635 [Alphaproteobacteria bacterium]|nr:hypothetical protein [Alphaproteobacteria bacterium]